MQINIRKLQSTLVISNSVISNNRLSRRENLVLFKRRTLTSGNKILFIRGKNAPK